MILTQWSIQISAIFNINKPLRFTGCVDITWPKRERRSDYTLDKSDLLLAHCHTSSVEMRTGNALQNTEQTQLQARGFFQWWLSASVAGFCVCFGDSGHHQDMWLSAVLTNNLLKSNFPWSIHPFSIMTTITVMLIKNYIQDTFYFLLWFWSQDQIDQI